MKDRTKPDAPLGHFKNGSAFVDPVEYADGSRDGLTKAEYVEAGARCRCRRLSENAAFAVTPKRPGSRRCASLASP